MSSTTTVTAVELQPLKTHLSKPSTSEVPNLKKIKEAIPAHCFKPSNFTSLSYIVWDFSLLVLLGTLAYNYVPLINNDFARWGAWAAYGVVEGMIMVSLWIDAHECGHQALFTNQLTNDTLGFLVHTVLLVPYFSWKYSHGLHHRYTNNMERDTAFVPWRKEEWVAPAVAAWREFLHLGEDAPVLNFASLVLHQLFGWPMYLLLNVTAGEGSLQNKTRKDSTRQSHFDFGSDIFTSKQHPFILLSDIGLAAMLYGLYWAGTQIGFANVALVYGVPYLWVNNWIVAITYLHHTHHEAHHFEAEQWTFVKGALGTVDRDFGFIGKHIFHGIIDHHVIHHLFTHIPFYHAEEATEAIKPVLGDRYLRVKTNFFSDLWKTWNSCRYVEPVDHNTGALQWARD